MRVYIAGRVSGLPYEEVKAKFDKAEVTLRASNYNPVNPLKHVNNVNTMAMPKTAMKVCLSLLLECDAVYLIGDWIFSEGAKIEAELARYAGLKILNEEDLTPKIS